MGRLARLAIILGFFWALTGGPFKILASSSAQALVDVDSAEYLGGDDYWVSGKRSGFWSPHPSDYNPMRRPNPLLRPNSKRDNEDNPYHPLAKVLNYHKHRSDIPEDYPVDGILEALEIPTHKKHIWPANLMFRLGQGGPPAPPMVNPNGNRKPKYVPSEPNNVS